MGRRFTLFALVSCLAVPARAAVDCSAPSPAALRARSGLQARQMRPRRSVRAFRQAQARTPRRAAPQSRTEVRNVRPELAHSAAQ